MLHPFLEAPSGITFNQNRRDQPLHYALLVSLNRGLGKGSVCRNQGDKNEQGKSSFHDFSRKKENR
jgi:hypothetical protein